MQTFNNSKSKKHNYIKYKLARFSFSIYSTDKLISKHSKPVLPKKRRLFFFLVLFPGQDGAVAVGSCRCSTHTTHTHTPLSLSWHVTRGWIVRSSTPVVVEWSLPSTQKRRTHTHTSERATELVSIGSSFYCCTYIHTYTHARTHFLRHI